MIIHTHFKKSKPKLKPKAEREEYQAWLAKHASPVKVKSTTFKPLKGYKLAIPEDRNPRKYASLDSGRSEEHTSELQSH